jgi:hypothetical protein
VSSGAPLSEALRVGLGWLDMEQPYGAIQSHHGIHGGTNWGGRINVGLIPRGWAGLPVVVFGVGNYVWFPERLANPFNRNEITRLNLAVSQVARVINTWNGEGSGSFSVAIDHGVHPTLDGALHTYRTGCPDHPHHILCGWPLPSGLDCPWYRTGHRLIRHPNGWGG